MKVTITRQELRDMARAAKNQVITHQAVYGPLSVADQSLLKLTTNLVALPPDWTVEIVE